MLVLLSCLAAMTVSWQGRQTGATQFQTPFKLVLKTCDNIDSFPLVAVSLFTEREYVTVARRSLRNADGFK